MLKVKLTLEIHMEAPAVLGFRWCLFIHPLAQGVFPSETPGGKSQTNFFQTELSIAFSPLVTQGWIICSGSQASSSKGGIHSSYRRRMKQSRMTGKQSEKKVGKLEEESSRLNQEFKTAVDNKWKTYFAKVLL